MPTVVPPAPASSRASSSTAWDDDDDDEGWQDMEVVRPESPSNGMDEEDQKRYRYVSSTTKSGGTGTGAGNATGKFNDIDYEGKEWRTKLDQNENEYTRLRVQEEDETDEVHMRTRYLFDEDKAMTPLSQMQATKNLLTEAQRVAYVGLCSLTTREMIVGLRRVGRKELDNAVKNLELWSLRIMGRLYYHMELATAEQKMIESLAEHGVSALDLAPALMTTHTVANPEYDPAEARKVQQEKEEEDEEDTSTLALPDNFQTSRDPGIDRPKESTKYQTTLNVMNPSEPIAMPGVSTSLSAVDKDVTLDIRWTVLCDLFLILIADSVYDARSRVLLENVATKLGLGWIDVVRFEKRVTEALEIEEGTSKLENTEVLDTRMKAAQKRRYVMMGLATVGGGLVIGLSAGLLAPVIGAGLGAALGAVGVSGTSAFLTGVGGAAVITTTGALTGSGIAVKGMARRTQQVRTFELLPLHNNKRVNCMVTVPGFMTNLQDDVRLPFSVLDPVVGDVFSIRWEPEMMGETGNALKILSGEVLTTVGQQVLQATVMTGLMSALQWPLLLTKLGYLIDNPWSNALDRAKAAGLVLADVLINRSLGVRPISLIGFSLGARMIFFCLLELARQKAYGIVQEVFLLGATLSTSQSNWIQARSVVAGRFVNCFARNDWILGYLFRATSGGLGTVAGLRPIENVPGLENVDVTDKIAGHLSYRTYMPLILDQLGFPVSADFFNEPEEIVMAEDREVVREETKAEEKKGFGSFFGRGKKPSISKKVIPPPGPSRSSSISSKTVIEKDEELPPREGAPSEKDASIEKVADRAPEQHESGSATASKIPKHAGFDFNAITEAIGKKGLDPNEIKVIGPGQGQVKPEGPLVSHMALANTPAPLDRSESAPPVTIPTTSLSSDTGSSLDKVSATHMAEARDEQISQSFARSMSMNNINELESKPSSETKTPDTPPTPRARLPSLSSLYTNPSFSNSQTSTSATQYNYSVPSYEPPPTLSFGSATGDIWTPHQESFSSPSKGWSDTSASFRYNASQKNSMANEFGSSSGSSSSPTSAGGSRYSSYPLPSPYGGGYQNNAGYESTLTFGDSTGGITSTIINEDPWVPKPIAGGTKKPAYTMNPWDT